MVKPIQRAAWALASAADAAASAATAVLIRDLGEDSRWLRSSRAAMPRPIRARRVSASRTILDVDRTQMMRWPSEDGHGAGVVCHIWSGPSLWREGRRAAWVHTGSWSTIQSRNWLSSLRVAGSTDTNLPPAAWMWSMLVRVASLESAT